ncbi:MurR/RpiR family transcriptional regulator [Rhizobium sullae]|uniref:MurR/RpiR family transcriptional regulator n=1 Tax=Rhizobium sullae TaxID=50338 RepID=A0A2N0CZF3_RHISU|nr:MurR/RpiR family transcriptional regulator [Rhizobium sullae]PKA39188.1 MurR/RpiR family transcriptional regulator [Rhizobium sullae]
MAITEKVQQSAGALTLAEKKLVEAILRKPKAAALSTASELAQGVEVHEATVSRLVRKLGYESYASFRSAMQAEFIPTQEPATRMENSLSRAKAGSLLSTLIAQEMSALAGVEDHVTMDVINDVASELMRARRILLFGRGNAEALSLMMLKRFRRFGCDASQLSGDPRDLAEQALGFGRGDVALIFAFRRAPRGYAPLIETLREAGARSIVISGASGALLAPPPDRLIGIPRSGEQDAFQTLTVPMTVCNAIVLAAGAQHKEKSLQMLDQLGTLIRRFE